MDSLNDAEYAVEKRKALGYIRAKAKDLGLSGKQWGVLEKYVEGMPADGRGEIRLDVLLGLLDNLERALRYDEPSFLTERRGFRMDRIPDVVEFVESKEYCGKKGFAWPSTLDNLWRIHHGDHADGRAPSIIVLSGASGTAKSYTTVFSAAYTTFLLLATWNPHLEFGQDPDDWIVLTIQSLKEETGRDSIYDKLRKVVDSCAWFRKHAPRRGDYNQQLQWPDRSIKIMLLTGQYDAAVGKNLFWCALNEVNKEPVYTRSKRLRHTNKNVLDVAERKFSTAITRLENRFSRVGGGFPGKLIIDSSRTHVNDLTGRMIEKAKTNPQILVIQRTLWEARAHEYPDSEPRFLVELGDDHRPPRIIEDEARAVNRVIRVPERHRSRFEDDIEEALAELAGEPTRQTGRFIPFPEKITKAQTAYVEAMGRARPFKFEEVSLLDLFGKLGGKDEIDWSLLINYDFFDLILDRETPFALHVDTSKSEDATGLAFGRIIGRKEVQHGKILDRHEGVVRTFDKVTAPVYQIDGILRIVARAGEQIDINIVRDLVLELSRLVNLKYVSADWLESHAMIMAWRRAGLLADKWSVDIRPDSYIAYKHALQEERLLMQPHKTNDHETRRLKKTVKGAKTKIDHVEGESKDVSDGVAGVIGVLEATEALAVYSVDSADRQDDGEGDLEDFFMGSGRRTGFGLEAAMPGGI